MKLSNRKKSTVRVSLPNMRWTKFPTQSTVQDTIRQNVMWRTGRDRGHWHNGQPNSKEWKIINADMSLILSSIKGSAEKKLEKLANLVCSYRKEKLGVKQERRNILKMCGIKSRQLRKDKRTFVFCSSAWLMHMDQFLISCSSACNNKKCQVNFWDLTCGLSTPIFTRVWQISISRYYCWVCHLPMGLHFGNSAHNQSLKNRSWTTATVCSGTTTGYNLYGWFWPDFLFSTFKSPLLLHLVLEPPLTNKMAF